MVNGLPGSMGREVAAAVLRRGYILAPYSLSGKSSHVINITSETSSMSTDEKEQNPTTLKEHPVQLVPSNTETTEATLKTYLDSVAGPIIIVDYTHPSAVNGNCELYCKLQVPYVMGTTGGDRDKVTSDTKKAGIYAVIAANMCKQIVALQTVLESMSTQFPGAFSGYTLKVTESHQSTKADTSGTAKEMVKYFNGLTSTQFQVNDIVKLREQSVQESFGVPSEHLNGHAFHTYTLESPTVNFEFKHNVCGRRTYAEGTVDAVEFLWNKMNKKDQEQGENDEIRIFNMIDVLKSGGMR